MKKVIVIGILALVVIGCVVAAGCTGTTTNGTSQASGMIPAQDYLDEASYLELQSEIDFALGEELKSRLESKQLSQAEYTQAFGNTTLDNIEEILIRPLLPASGTIADQQLQPIFSKILIGEKKFSELSSWSNADLSEVIQARIAQKDSTVSEALKTSGTMREGRPINIIIYIDNPDFPIRVSATDSSALPI